MHSIQSVVSIVYPHMPTSSAERNSDISRLQRARELLEELERTQAELYSVLGFTGERVAASADRTPFALAGKRGMSQAGRERIAAAQRARWAKHKAGAPGSERPSGKKKRTMSPEARAKIAAAQKKRWAKQKAGK
jgi:hypothetical protein